MIKITYEHGLFGEFLGVKLLQRDRRDWRVCVFSLESCIGDKGGDVLFELSKIRDNVVFSEGDAVLVVHLLGYAKEEFALFEHVHHHANVLLDLLELLLGGIGLVHFRPDVIFQHGYFDLKGFLQIYLLLVRHLASLNNLGDLLSDVLIRLL